MGQLTGECIDFPSILKVELGQGILGNFGVSFL